jgi:hypothetical protein
MAGQIAEPASVYSLEVHCLRDADGVIIDHHPFPFEELAELLGEDVVLPAVDVMVAGEMREWEGVEYVRDVVAAGQKKGLVLLGRIVSEEPGMRACAAWLNTILPELPATWIAAGDPYWRPR